MQDTRISMHMIKLPQEPKTDKKYVQCSHEGEEGEEGVAVSWEGARMKDPRRRRRRYGRGLLSVGVAVFVGWVAAAAAAKRSEGRLYEHWRSPYIRPVTCVGSATSTGQLSEGVMT
ncbi:hypothetical protein B296_00042609 [Ensete ventricosum]|uniref:Uncharacterized protein n=1 Tax=Ensete ventricosum TaxID=4639 RepID=A0A426X7A8_ENSVE|nr:hypothetical protein B296_00042609 [Ensete ventricosum]